MLMLEANLLNG